MSKGSNNVAGVSALGQIMRDRTKPTLWWHEINNQANFYMATKAFWLRSAAHYRDPYWRNVKEEMECLRNIKRINVRLRESITG